MRLVIRHALWMALSLIKSAQIEMYGRGFADLPESQKAGNIQIEVLKQLDEEWRVVW